MRGALGSTSNQWHMIVDGHSTYFVKPIDDCIESRPSATDTTPNDMCTRTAGRAAPLNGDMLATWLQHSMSRMSLP